MPKAWTRRRELNPQLRRLRARLVGRPTRIFWACGPQVFLFYIILYIITITAGRARRKVNEGRRKAK